MPPGNKVGFSGPTHLAPVACRGILPDPGRIYMKREYSGIIAAILVILALLLLAINDDYQSKNFLRSIHEQREGK